MTLFPPNISITLLKNGQLNPILSPLIDAALMAGAAIMDIYRQETVIMIKDDGSPVTQADHQAEIIILSILSKNFPDIPIVAEEKMAAGLQPLLSDTIFLIDPLDGTKEFIAQSGEFTVNIAVIHKGKPIIGVVYAPALECLYCGVVDDCAMIYNVHKGAIDHGTKISVRSCKSDIVTIVSSRSHSSLQINQVLSAFNHVNHKTIGSSLKFCLIALGDADLYLRLGQTMEWDTAAGDAILRAAGGQVLDLNGHHLTYNKPHLTKNNNFSNPHFIATGDFDVTEILHSLSK